MSKVTGNKLDDTLKIKCPWCYKSTELKDWDSLTYSKCSNREMKRAYTHLDNSKAFNKNCETYYICPKCEKWSAGATLKIVDTDDEFLKSLGGESILRYGNKN